MRKPPDQVTSIRELTNLANLKLRFGSFDIVTNETVETVGFSGAQFSRISLNSVRGQLVQNLIVKEVNLKNDWFAQRTQDTVGREAKILTTPALEHIFNIFYSPYHLIAMEPGRVGLLMEDLSNGLFPDERKSIPVEDQDLILNKLAEMHAHFWESNEVRSLSWLHSADDFIYLIGPKDHTDSSIQDIRQSVSRGWEVTMKLLPKQIREAFLADPLEIVKPWNDLPMTLIHGDSKVANFAKSDDGQLSLLDWAFVGFAPCTFEIGWFLAVNATRLADTKERVLQKYRDMLEKHLESSISDPLWTRLEEAGIVCGAFMLLWSKGVARAKESSGADIEWKWWVNHLENWIKNRI